MAPRRSARLKVVENITTTANVTTVATSTIPPPTYSRSITRREEFQDHLQRTTPRAVILAYLRNRYQGFSLVQRALLSPNAIYNSADATAAAHFANAQVCWQRAVKAKERTRRFNACLITAMKNKEDRKRALHALDKQQQGVWSELPAELFNLVIEKLAEFASKEYEGNRIYPTSAHDVDDLCDELMPDMWQRRLGCVASPRNNLFEKNIFEIDLTEVYDGQIVTGPYTMEPRHVWTIPESLLRYASGILRLHITLTIGPQAPTDGGYVAWDGACHPTMLYAFIDDLERAIEEDFPRLDTIHVTIDDRCVDRAHIIARNEDQVLGFQNYVDEIENVTDVISRLKVRQVYQRFLKPLVEPFAHAHGYIIGRRARGFQSEGEWKNVTVNTA
ncbi:hypothetical protein LTR56_009999 [Elasticomyces elasticus]|nr:hypothetical protein LTR56_009999 [Elasticomyces elasticus]KAK3665063.1 hypothetical protein LTR22_004119 [Elasticomyces elasticus]KAK4931562.1 hypothetical protein LTR49_001950 [Elasticomyces elasticus]KAK5766722.1 hypothetical protein LTS12_003071 [Elasticomyces elasticus]